MIKTICNFIFEEPPVRDVNIALIEGYSHSIRLRLFELLYPEVQKLLLGNGFVITLLEYSEICAIRI